MGEKLVRYYQLVEEKAGLLGKVRLAMKTSIPSHKAKSEEDSKENLALFVKIIKEILGTDVPLL